MNPTVRMVLRRLTLVLFVCATAAIAVVLGEAILSATGLMFDAHGYAIFAGIFLAAILTPVALVLWLIYRALRDR